MIIKDTKDFSKQELFELFSSVGWVSAKRADKIVIAMKNSYIVKSVWEDGKLVALARVLGDGVWQATIDCVLVDKNFQKQGIGSKLIEEIKKECQDILYLNVIPDEKKNVEFYVKNGFNIIETGTLMQKTAENWW